MPKATFPDIQALSERGQSLAVNAARIDMDLFAEAARDLYDPAGNPDGKFPLNVAENGPMIPRMQAQLQQILQASPLPRWVFQYTEPTGYPQVREVMAQFLEKYLFGVPVDPASLAFSAGASAVIEVSAFVLANPGEVVAIPAPSYPMYTNDLGLKSGMERYDLQTHTELADHGPEGPVTPQLLDQAWLDLQAQGKTLKMVLLTSPDNPTGTVYSKTRLREIAAWCTKKQVHLVVNEIYGLSLLGAIGESPAEARRQASFAELMAVEKSPYLHLWYALSKDFAMSGFRFGIVHSHNTAFLAAYGNANIPHMVSNLTQWLMGELFQDTAFLDAYVREHQQSLQRSYEVVTRTLDQLGLPYLPAAGSLFVWADFSRFLTEDTAEAEQALWESIFRQSGVLLTPGAGFGHQKRGLFRIVFTAVPTEQLQVAMDRLRGALGDHPR